MIARPLAPRAPIPFASPDWVTTAPTLTSRTAGPASTLPRRSPVQLQAAPAPAPAPAPVSEPHPTATARFMGQGRLSVRSSITGRHYRFSGHGDTQAVDARDTLMLRRMPDLHID